MLRTMGFRGGPRLLLVAAVLQVAACGGGAVEAPPAPSPVAPVPAPDARWPLTATVILTAEGPDPASVTVSVGGRVTFINRDTRTYEIVSDPYLRHEDCPPLNYVGVLAPGQQRDSRIFEAARSCGFHDHLNPAYTGRIDVRID